MRTAKGGRLHAGDSRMDGSAAATFAPPDPVTGEAWAAIAFFAAARACLPFAGVCLGPVEVVAARLETVESVALYPAGA